MPRDFTASHRFRDRGREYLPQGARPVRPELHLLWIAERNLFEPHAVLPGRARDMQVPVDHRQRTEPQMPVGRPIGPAPLSELRIMQAPGGLTNQRKMVYQHRSHSGRQGPQPPLGRLYPRFAPRLPARIRIVVQHRLIGAYHAGLIRQGEPLGLRRRASRAEGVVVQHEQRHDHDRPALTLPHGERILWRQHAEVPAYRYQVLVPGRAPQLDRIGAEGPQLMIAGNPYDRGEPRAEGAQRPLDGVGSLPDVADHEQPVVRRLRPEVSHEFPVFLESDMKVTDREQLPWRSASQLAVSFVRAVSRSFSRVTKAAGSSILAPRVRTAWLYRTCAQSARRGSSCSRLSLAISGCCGLISSTGWLGSPVPRIRRARLMSISGSLAMMQAGEVVSRLLSRTSHAWPARYA